jgi:hypothetical protein
MPATSTIELSNPLSPEWLEIVRRNVDGLNYGFVQIVVHDHHVTQIERTEKTRLDAPIADSLPRRREHA